MLINPCDTELDIHNTGSECGDAMEATYGFAMAPLNDRWTKQDIIDAGSFTEFARQRLHADPAQRWLYIGGKQAKISGITENNEADVIETMDDGSTKRIRAGFYNRTFLTKDGGLCLAQAWAGNDWEKYGMVEFDKAGKVNQMKIDDETYAAFPLSDAFAPSPDLANFKTSYKNKFYLSIDPIFYIMRAVILKGDATEDLINLTGLIDTQVLPGADAATTTEIFVNVNTLCANADLVALYTGTGAGKIGQITNFIVKDDTGTPVVPSAVAIINGQVRLTGTYPAGDYTVELNAPSVLLANGIAGYAGIKAATVTTA